MRKCPIVVVKNRIFSSYLKNTSVKSLAVELSLIFASFPVYLKLTFRARWLILLTQQSSNTMRDRSRVFTSLPTHFMNISWLEVVIFALKLRNER